nr:MAG TPA: hypothetical protein [Caudoviricetes sp.]
MHGHIHILPGIHSPAPILKLHPTPLSRRLGQHSANLRYLLFENSGSKNKKL